jgi:hypothetical protein
MGLAGYKMISMVLLVVLVALAGLSPVFAQVFAFRITLDLQAACPGETVTISNIPILTDVVGGGISIAAVSPLDGLETLVLSSDPGGLIANSECSTQTGTCSFVVSESATCGGHYTVIVTLSTGGVTRGIGSADFDVAGPCCAAVGGCVQPVNTFALVSPWLVAIGLIGCIGTVVVVAKKRRQ